MGEARDECSQCGARAPVLCAGWATCESGRVTGLGRVGKRACGEVVQGRGSAHVGAVEVVGGRQDDHGAT